MTALAMAASRATVEVVLALVTFVAMDFWAAMLHRRFWHGPLWVIHRTHHAARVGRFEANDWLSVLHAPIAVALILYGCGGAGRARAAAFAVGVGMTAFGAAYLVVHDGLVHGRLPVRALLRLAPLRAIVRAHEEHHRGRGGAPYGLLFGPWELRRNVNEKPESA